MNGSAKGMKCLFVAAGLIAGLAAPARAQTVYVSTNGSHDVGNNFNSWAGAATNLNEAVILATTLGWNVMASNGTYQLTNQITLATGIAVQSVNGPGVTTLNRDGAYGNFRICSVTHGSALVSGFTMKNGYITSGNGGGIEQTAGTVSNCVFTLNHADGYGGVVSVSGGLMTHCVVTNAESGYARGIVTLSGTGILQDSEIVASPSAERYPLGISGGIVRRCRIHHNRGTVGYVYMTGGLLENSVIYSNSGNSAGGVYLNNSAARMVNCTVVGNSLPGVRLDSGTITNSIIYGNGANGPAENYSGAASACWYSCAPELTNSAQGNTTLNPNFVNLAGMDYRLAVGSPCVDTGTNLASVTTDMEGTTRPLAGDSRGTLRHDMGAYERNGAVGALAIGFLGTPLAGINSITSVFTAAVSGTNTSIAWWGWDFETDGTNNLEGTDLAVVTNTFGLGRYTVSVRVTNSVGETAAATNVNYVLVPGTDIYVATNGGHRVPFASWADAATNLNDAVDLALAGCTVHVSNGSHRITKKLDVFTAFTIRGENGPGATTVWRSSADPKFGLLDLRDAGALVSGLTLTNGNVSGVGGAGLLMSAGTVSNCVFLRCLTEVSYAGALTVSGGRVTTCVISNISHTYPIIVLSGSAILEDSQMMNCSGINNSYGVLQMGSGTLARRCRFDRITGSSPYLYLTGGRLENCLVYSNSAAEPYLGPAGGVYLTGGTMVNCTVANNQRTGGTASGVKQTGGTITNCIIYGNGAGAPADNYSGSALACWYSCAPSPDVTNGVQGCITADPQFAGASTGNYHLAVGSLCRDTGTNVWTASDLDLDRASRKQGSYVDMGAYEFDPSSVPFSVAFTMTPAAGIGAVTSVLTATMAGSDTNVSWWGWDFDNDGTHETNGTGLAVVTNVFGLGRHSVSVAATNGSGDYACTTNLNCVLVVGQEIFVATNGGSTLPYASWANAATSFNDAVDIAQSGCVVRVTNGIYRMTKKADLFSPIAIRSENGPGSTTLYRDTNVTVFGMFDLRDPGAALSGFTITNGGVVVRSVLYMTAGTVSNCVMTRNDLQWVDRGMLVLSGGRLSRCVMTNNYAFYGLGIFSGTMEVEDCQFVNNTCGQYGFIQMSGGTMRRCNISSNDAADHTGGVALGGGRMENCLVSRNVARSTWSAAGAGGVVMSGGTLVNCTVAGNAKSNAASPSAGGVVLAGGALTNCIVYGNTGGQTNNYYGTMAAAWYSCAQGLTQGSQGNITNDPVFVAASNGNFRLKRESPCLNAGTNQVWMIGAVDLDENPRIKQSRVDMGAYELPPALGTILELR